MGNTILTLIDKGIVQTDEIVDSVGDEQWGEPTLCTDWNVGDVVRHVAAWAVVFTAAIDSQPTTFEDLSKDVVGADPKAGFHAVVERSRVAWCSPDVLGRTLELPFGPMSGETAAKFAFIDVLVHGLDLAVAIGGDLLVDDALCSSALELARSMGIDNLRMPGMYGPEVVVGQDQRAYRRLLGYMGRAV
jgi:uncharacterized protein (TIGR03086 family)